MGTKAQPIPEGVWQLLTPQAGDYLGVYPDLEEPALRPGLPH